MTDDKDGVRAYSKDGQVYRHNPLVLRRQVPAPYRHTGDNYYSNRNCPEILSVFALQQRQSKDREKEIYYSRSSSNDDRYFNMINYPIQSPPPPIIPIPTSISQNEGFEITVKETKLPQLTPRKNSNGPKTFPIITSRSTSSVNRNSYIPIIRSPVNRLSVTQAMTISKFLFNQWNFDISNEDECTGRDERHGYQKAF